MSSADLRSRIDFLKGATDSVSDGVDGVGDLAEPVETIANTSAKRVADDPIPLGSQKRRRIINSESSNSESEEPPLEKLRAQDVVQQKVEAVDAETPSTAASTTSRKRFAVLDSSDSE